jgi:hypothetical protein
MKTLQKQTSLFGEDKSTSFPEGFHVNPTHLQENGSARMTSATCGPRCLEQFEKFNHVGLWAKTFSALLIGMEGWSSKRCRLTWKLRGTKYNRLYFQLQVLALRTKGTVFGLLPTPTTRDWKGARTSEALRHSGRNGMNSLPDYFAQPGKTTQLNPQFVMETMGFPKDWTVSPFLSGEWNQSKQEEMQ